MRVKSRGILEKKQLSFLARTGAPKKTKLHYWSVLVLSTSLLLPVSLSSPVQAIQPLESASYRLQMSNFNTTAGEKSSSSYNLTDTVGQTAPGQYTGSSTLVKSGFQYIYDQEDFTFSISDTSLDLNSVSVGAFSEANNTLTVSTSTPGYQVSVLANQRLTKSGGSTIPFTNCDVSCSPSSANTWNNVNRPGFGFNASGTHVSSDFINTSYFRPFADLSQSQTAQVIASHNSSVSNDTIDVLYRLGITVGQPAGTYNTSLEFTAIPTY